MLQSLALLIAGITAPFVGELVDNNLGSAGDLIYGPVFYVFTALMLLSAFITLFLPFKMDIPNTSFVRITSIGSLVE